MSYIGASPTNVAFVTDTFTGTGSTTAFTMSVAPASTSSILVAITGVLQDPSTYSVSGTTLTFSAAPPSGTNNISVRYLGIPASGVTTTAYRTVTNFTATAGQTTFTPPSYTAGYIDVYRNGSKLALADFTATNGTTVVLANACNAGDVVETDSFYVSSVLNAIPATAGAVNSTYIANGAVGSTQLLDANVTPAKLSQPLTSGTAQASTSGTSIDFTGIPSWAKRITVMFNGVSTNGSSPVEVRIGSGSVTASGYISYGSTNGASITSTTGFVTTYTTGATYAIIGVMQICLVSGNVYVASSGLALNPLNATCGGGNVTLSGVLDRVRITTQNGTDTFDAGSINILYE